MSGVNQREIGQGERTGATITSQEKCGNCQFFNRWQWDEAYGGGQQGGGDCSHLLDVIRLTNAKLWALDRLHVQESFGCSLYRKAE